MSNTDLIVLSANGRDDFGGLFVIENGAAKRIDHLPTNALCKHGSLLYRMNMTREFEGGEILVYDLKGVLRYHRVDAIGQPHDLLARADGTLLAVGTFTNEIFSLADDGSVESYWSAGAPSDAWHLNCLTERDGRLYATAFGSFTLPFGWSQDCKGTGFIFDVASGERIVVGLTKPHTPRFFDDVWTVCDSGTGRFLRIDANGRQTALELGGFLRGTCVTDEFVYVGSGTAEASGLRGSIASGFISIIDRKTWQEVERVPLPCSSIYDIIAVDAQLLEALRTGFRFESRRSKTFGQLAMFEQVGVEPSRLWATGERLPKECVRSQLRADFPRRVAINATIVIDCEVSNEGAAMFTSAPPYPVFLCYRWFDGTGAPIGAGTWLHTPLPRSLPPRERLRVSMPILSPPDPGMYHLHVTPLQAGVWWFDEVDAANGIRFSVEVV